MQSQGSRQKKVKDAKFEVLFPFKVGFEKGTAC